MSDEHDKPKPGAVDPEATVSLQRDRLATPPVDEDATVSIQRDSLTEPPARDEDATVMIPAMKTAPEEDEDATVMMKPLAPGPAADEDATVMMSPAMAAGLSAAATDKETPDFDPDATNVFVPAAESAPASELSAAATATPPAPAAAASSASATAAPPAPVSNIPWNAIAGGVVVLLVILYFVFSGGQSTPPEPIAATPPAPAAPTPALAPASPVAATPAPAAAPAAPPSPPAAPAAPVATAPSVSVTSLLAEDIRRGLVEVRQADGVATITLRDARQFDAGDVEPEARLRPVLQAIAAALDKVPGAIIVTGHADTSPSSDKRFPTNQELSVARAEAAARVMAEKLRDPGRLKSEGASDTKPLVPNDSIANRAKNRRVVIVVRPAA